MTAHRENDPLVGLWQQFPTPMASRFLAQMGWDFVVLDLQHGCLDYETVYECIHTLRACGCRPWVRTAIGNCSEINKVLDLGAQGVVVPMINSREEAERAAAAAKYPPAGGRSFGGDSWNVTKSGSYSSSSMASRSGIFCRARRTYAEFASVLG